VPLMERMMAPAVHEHPVAQHVRSARQLLDDVIGSAGVTLEGDPAEAAYPLLAPKECRTTLLEYSL